ncbi:hypothetical protein HOB10_01985 [Candidatus Parcubacteria bacterium]|nr:hypothetical protein [Candidatus Parcubacteria bacterium]
MSKGWPLAVGVFLGNWLAVPVVFSNTHKEGFFIGLVAAGLVLLFFRLKKG